MTSATATSTASIIRSTSLPLFLFLPGTARTTRRSRDSLSSSASSPSAASTSSSSRSSRNGGVGRSHGKQQRNPPSPVTAAGPSRKRAAPSATTTTTPPPPPKPSVVEQPPVPAVEEQKTPAMEPVSQRWEETEGKYLHKKFKKMATMKEQEPLPPQPSPPPNPPSQLQQQQQPEVKPPSQSQAPGVQQQQQPHPMDAFPLKHSALSMLAPPSSGSKSLPLPVVSKTYVVPPQDHVIHPPETFLQKQQQQQQLAAPPPAAAVLPQHQEDEARRSSSSNRYPCPYCSIECAKPSVLEKHIRIHTNERPFPCEPCGFAFKTKSNLFKHRKSRTHLLKVEKGIDSSKEEIMAELGENMREELEQQTVVAAAANPPPHSDIQSAPKVTAPTSSVIVLSSALPYQQQQQPHVIYQPGVSRPQMPPNTQGHPVNNSQISLVQQPSSLAAKSSSSDRQLQQQKHQLEQQHLLLQQHQQQRLLSRVQLPSAITSSQPLPPQQFSDLRLAIAKPGTGGQAAQLVGATATSSKHHDFRDVRLLQNPLPPPAQQQGSIPLQQQHHIMMTTQQQQQPEQPTRRYPEPYNLGSSSATVAAPGVTIVTTNSRLLLQQQQQQPHKLPSAPLPPPSSAEPSSVPQDLSAATANKSQQAENVIKKIDQLVSENQAIVDTLDPLWVRRYKWSQGKDGEGGGSGGGRGGGRKYASLPSGSNTTSSLVTSTATAIVTNPLQAASKRKPQTQTSASPGLTIKHQPAPGQQHILSGKSHLAVANATLDQKPRVSTLPLNVLPPPMTANLQQQQQLKRNSKTAVGVVPQCAPLELTTTKPSLDPSRQQLQLVHQQKLQQLQSQQPNPPPQGVTMVSLERNNASPLNLSDSRKRPLSSSPAANSDHHHPHHQQQQQQQLQPQSVKEVWLNSQKKPTVPPKSAGNMAQLETLADNLSAPFHPSNPEGSMIKELLLKSGIDHTTTTGTTTSSTTTTPASVSIQPMPAGSGRSNQTPVVEIQKHQQPSSLHPHIGSLSSSVSLILSTPSAPKIGNNSTNNSGVSSGTPPPPLRSGHALNPAIVSNGLMFSKSDQQHIKCQYCSQTYQKADLEAHHKFCPKAPMSLQGTQQQTHTPLLPRQAPSPNKRARLEEQPNPGTMARLNFGGGGIVRQVLPQRAPNPHEGLLKIAQSGGGGGLVSISRQPSVSVDPSSIIQPPVISSAAFNIPGIPTPSLSGVLTGIKSTPLFSLPGQPRVGGGSGFTPAQPLTTTAAVATTVPVQAVQFPKASSSPATKSAAPVAFVLGIPGPNSQASPLTVNSATTPTGTQSPPVNLSVTNKPSVIPEIKVSPAAFPPLTLAVTPGSVGSSKSEVKVNNTSSAPGELDGKFLRPNSLSLTPGSFKQKKNVMVASPAGATLVSPETPRPRKAYVLTYQNGTAYTHLGMKCSTRSYFCTISRPQPVFIANKPNISMYSNWKVMDKDSHPSGLSPKAHMSAYDSVCHNNTNGIFTTARSSNLNSKSGQLELAVTHSSMWKGPNSSRSGSDGTAECGSGGRPKKSPKNKKEDETEESSNGGDKNGGEAMDTNAEEGEDNDDVRNKKSFFFHLEFLCQVIFYFICRILLCRASVFGVQWREATRPRTTTTPTCGAAGGASMSARAVASGAKSPRC